MSLPARKIGNALVSPIGFGVMGISRFYGAVGTDEERFQVCSTSASNTTTGYSCITV